MSYEQPPAPDPQEGSAAPTRACTWCRCPDLEQGFVADVGQGSRGFSQWIAGPLETGPLGGARVMGKDRYEIQAWRCTRCGHLEHFVVSP